MVRGTSGWSCYTWASSSGERVLVLFKYWFFGTIITSSRFARSTPILAQIRQVLEFNKTKMAAAPLNSWVLVGLPSCHTGEHREAMV